MKRIAAFVILFAVCANAGSPSLWIHVSGGSWDPGEADLVDVRERMQEYVAGEAARIDAKLQRWETYRFQYQGRLKGKRQVIFINAFCHTFGDERLEEVILGVFDGGPCYFNLEYNPKTRKFRSLVFNGPYG